MAHDAHHAEGHAHAHWDTSVWPFVISFGIMFVAVAFSLHFVYHSSFAAVLSLGLALPMICLDDTDAGLTDTARQRLIYDTDSSRRVPTDCVAQLGRTRPLDHFDSPRPKERRDLLETVPGYIHRDDRQFYSALHRFQTNPFSPHHP